MIEYGSNLIQSWKNKIVYAPNGFGKTTASNRLEKALNESGVKTLLLTRRQMNSLIALQDDIIYFGKNAQKKYRNNVIRDGFRDQSGVKHQFKKIYNTIDKRKIKSVSLFSHIHSFIDLDDIEHISVILEKAPFNDLKLFGQDIALVFDRSKTAIELYDGSIFLQNITKNSPIVMPQNDNLKSVTTDFLNWIKNINDYLTDKDWRICPLCGTEFESPEQLKNKIKTTIESYIDDNDPYKKLQITVFNIVDFLTKLDNVAFAYVIRNSLKDNTIESFLEIINRFIEVCYYASRLAFETMLASTDFENKQLKTVVEEYLTNKHEIEDEINSISNIEEFSSFVLERFNEIVSLNDGSRISSSNQNKLEFYFETEDQSLKGKSLYEILSESEMKRFCLAVIHGFIKFYDYKGLILDDPIDSYDDYCLFSVCHYIGDIVKTPGLCWYILTNNFSALEYLSEETNEKSVIYYDDPDAVFNGKKLKTKRFEANSSQIKIAASSEIVQLKNYLNGNEEIYDNDLSFIALVTTLRNFKSTFLSNFKKVYLGKNAKYRKRAVLNKSFRARVSSEIEAYYMHYLPNKTKKIFVRDLATLYMETTTVTNVEFQRYRSHDNDKTIIQMREDVAKKPFNSFKGSKLLNLIFQKMSMISYLKYEMEKRLFEELEKTFSSDDLFKVAKKHSLGKKIEKAQEIDNASYGSLNSHYLNKYYESFLKHRVMFNAFDHGLERMIPPYIAASIKDLIKFKTTVSSL